MPWGNEKAHAQKAWLLNARELRVCGLGQDAEDSAELASADRPGGAVEPAVESDKLAVRIAAVAGGRVENMQNDVGLGAPRRSWGFELENDAIVLEPSSAVRPVKVASFVHD